MLNKTKYQFNPRRTFIKPIITDKTKKQARFFYGNCSPIYSKNGNHTDPICAFTCLSCYPELWLVHIEKYSLTEIYRELEKRRNCSALLYVSKSGIVDMVKVEEFLNKRKRHNVQQDMQNSKWRFNPARTSNNFQCQVHFVLR